MFLIGLWIFKWKSNSRWCTTYHRTMETLWILICTIVRTWEEMQLWTVNRFERISIRQTHLKDSGWVQHKRRTSTMASRNSKSTTVMGTIMQTKTNSIIRRFPWHKRRTDWHYGHPNHSVKMWWMSTRIFSIDQAI